jgi:hypothetical protein
VSGLTAESRHVLDPMLARNPSRLSPVGRCFKRFQWASCSTTKAKTSSTDVLGIGHFDAGGYASM